MLSAGLSDPDYWRTLLLALVVFWLPGALLWLILAWRAVREIREGLKTFKRDAEASAAEGFPPPGPPTTDHPTRDQS